MDNPNPEGEKDLLDTLDEQEDQGSANEKDEGNSTSENTESETDPGGSESEDTDYKELYVSSQQEFQKKYRPMEKGVKALLDKTGKSLDELIAEAPEEEQTKEEPKESSEDVEAVAKRLDSLEGAYTERVRRETTLSVNKFLKANGIDNDYYDDQIVPHLKGIKDMVNPSTGEPYPFDEGLEIALDIAKRKERLASQKKQDRAAEAEKNLANTPSGEAHSQTAQNKDNTFNEEQLDVAGRMGVNLQKKKDSK